MLPAALPSYARQGFPWTEVLPVYMHLLLAAVVVTTSWIGWTQSVASKAVAASKVFSWAFLVLLLDLFLVVCYFLLVRGAEVPTGTELVFSARSESGWIAVTFVGYFMWDFLTKGVLGPEGSWAAITKRIRGDFWKRGNVSFAVALWVVPLVVFFLYERRGYWPVIFADVSLLAVVLGFRAWKQGLAFTTGCFAVVSLAAAVTARCLDQ